MPKSNLLPRSTIALVAMLAVSFAGASAALAAKVVVGPVSVDVPDDFKAVAGDVPAIRQESSGITIEASELPAQALHEWQGQTFLDFLKSLGYADPTYANGALKRTGSYTYVLADAKGTKGPESRFLLVIGGEGRAAIVTVYAPKSEIANGHARRDTVEAILDSATLVPASGAAPAKP
jgi:hypothetical protein